MKSKIAVLVRYDFCHQSDDDELHETLSKLYRESGEKHGGATMDGGSWTMTTYSGTPNNVEGDFPEFASIKTFVSPNNRHITDIATVAELSKSQVTEIEENDSSRTHVLIGNWISSLDEIASNLPTVVEVTEHREKPVILYVEPENQQDISNENSRISVEKIQSILKENREFIGKFHFLLGHPISLLGTEDLVSPHSSGDRWGSLTVLNLSSTFEADDREGEEIMGALWLRRLDSNIKPYFRLYYWCRHRLSDVYKIDERTHGIDELVSHPDEDQDDLEAILNIESDLETLRESWTDTYTKSADELAELKAKHEFLEEAHEEIQHSIPIPAPAEGIVIEGKDGLIEQYQEDLRILASRLQANLDRVADKQDRISAYVRDLINAKSTETSIHLQREVNYLTWLLLILTVSLVLSEFRDTITDVLFISFMGFLFLILVLLLRRQFGNHIEEQLRSIFK